MKGKNKYGDTLNLPQTSFPMRGDLARREPEMLALWERGDLYRRVRDNARGRERFVLHDGPPYANGALHMGHAVNKILKDIVVRGKTLAGCDSPYLPGWDCHGLPIEHQVEKQGADRRDAAAFRRRCRAFADSQIDVQRRGFIRMGICGEWQTPYKTMAAETEAGIIRALGGIVRQGLVVHRLKPVLWCADCESALAEAEVEYADRDSPAVDVAFAAADEEECRRRFAVEKTPPIFAVIWTTTAWTLPANRAIVVHPEIPYSLVEADGRCFIVAEMLREAATARWQKSARLLATVDGAKLSGLVFRHPFYPRESPIFCAAHVTADAGTGLVHTAPGHGEDDFNVGIEHDLPLDSPVDGRGRFLPDLPLFGGQSVWAATENIAAKLQETGALLAREEYRHSYPLCWRHKSPILFRATWQWFVVMDKQKPNGKTLREEALAAVEQTKFYPAWGKNRLRAMIAARPDWCLSRQRVWNVPIPFFVHRQSGELHPRTEELLEQAAKAVEQGGIEAWYETTAQTWLGDEAADYEKIPDALDVWFDSGCTHQAVMHWDGEDNATRPDMYLEGSDQHRGWFHSSLLTGAALYGAAPYRQILTHGFVIDVDGRKMSKSEGNVSSPQQVIDRYGADILRLWVGASDYAGEITVSEEILNRIVETYRRIRNTLRFLLANLSDFDTRDALPPDTLLEIDRYMLALAEQRRAEFAALYARHEYHTFVRRAQIFCSIDLGGFYLDILKDRLYTFPPASRARRSAQTALRQIAELLLKSVSPILCFTADEGWRVLFGDEQESPQLHTWTTPLPQPADAQVLLEKWGRLREHRRLVSATIERAREEGIIRGSLEAAVSMPAPADAQTREDLLSLAEELRYVYIVSSATVGEGEGKNEGEEIRAVKSAENKCARCWHHEKSVGDDGLCARCAGVLAGKETARRFV